ncbi:MAG: RidA family protein [Acidobacteriota bacterium]
MDFIHTADAPAALGPYSQAVRVDGFLYTSGQVGIDPSTGTLVDGFEAQARQVLANLRAVLAAAGCQFSDVVKTTIFVTDLANFALLNTLYGEAMGDHRPARSTVQVPALPAGAEVEIELVVRVPGA